MKGAIVAVDFTVIQPVRQRFGDEKLEGEFPTEAEAPFVGYAKEFPFACPNVDASQMAVLHLESLGLTAAAYYQIFIQSKDRNTLQINGVDVPGGLTPSPWVPGPSGGVEGREWPGGDLYFWKAHSLLVPANVLREENVLYVESVLIAVQEVDVGVQEQRDNFIIDNVVLFYKTLVREPGERPDVGPPIGDRG